MSIFSKLFKKDHQTNLKQDNQYTENISQAGKSYDEMLPYLMSGEPDDVSTDFTNKI